MEEELGMEEEAGASSLCFILLSCSVFLEGLLAKSFLGDILGFGRILARGLLGFCDFWKDLGEFLEGRRGRGVSKIDLGEKCRHETCS